MGHDNTDRADVIVVGAGIMGACLTYFLTQRGLRTLVLDRTGPAAEASGANAGMISASSGIPGHTLALSQLSANLYEKAISELSDPIDYNRTGKLLLAFSADEVTALEQFIHDRQGSNLQIEMIYGPDVLKLEPALSERVIAAAHIADDGQIDPFRATVSFLRTACQLGATFKPGVSVDEVAISDHSVIGVRVGDEVIRARHVVIAAGARSASLAATIGLQLPVIPGRGQMLITTPLPPLTTRVIHGDLVGFRQLANGSLVFGSEVEFVGHNYRVVPHSLGRYAQELREMVPMLSGQTIIKRVWAGLRPMSPDNLPIVGPVPGVEGLYVLTGHGRTGMGMGPASALAVAELISDGSTQIPIEKLGVDRFSSS